MHTTKGNEHQALLGKSFGKYSCQVFADISGHFVLYP
jgi:hypothetical protein